MNGVHQLIGVVNDARGTCVLQFFAPAKPPQHAERVSAAMQRRLNVLVAVTNHQGAGGRRFVVSDQVRQQVGFAIKLAVEFGTMNAVEIAGELKMGNDAFGKNSRLAGAERNGEALEVQCVQRLGDTVVQSILQPAERLVAFAVKRQRRFGVDARKHAWQRFAKRRPDKGQHLGVGERYFAEPFEREIQAARDAQKIIRDRAVKVKKKRGDRHVKFSLCNQVLNMSQKFNVGRVVGRTDHTDTLFSLQFEADIEPFIAGQFCRVGLPLPADVVGDELVMRPYSLINAPGERPYEIILSKVPADEGGILSPVLHQLKPGDELFVSPRCNGYFSMPEVPDAAVLWALCTGTAVGPYLSFMKTDVPWKKFARIVFVHAVRTATELTYREQIDAIAAAHPTQFQYIPFVSREKLAGAMSGRIPAAIIDGSLEARAGAALKADTAHCMLCGSPDMVRDTSAVLHERGLRKHRPKLPGHITVEAYW